MKSVLTYSLSQINRIEKFSVAIFVYMKLHMFEEVRHLDLKNLFGCNSKLTGQFCIKSLLKAYPLTDRIAACLKTIRGGST